MSLKYRYTNQEEIPAEQQALYTEQDGAWVLAVEGVVERTQLEEFWQNHAAVVKERDELKSRFEGIDPERVRELEAEKRRWEEDEAVRNGQVEKLIASRVQTARADLEQEVARLASEREALEARLAAVQIDQGVIRAATERGLRSTAIPDITARARQVFKLVDGQPRAYEPESQLMRAGRDGLKPLTVEEWVETQMQEAPHLFESHAGSNAPGGRYCVAAIEENPWRAETLNLTKQGQILKHDPVLAKVLMQAARAAKRPNC